jgi:hypothetical protein
VTKRTKKIAQAERESITRRTRRLVDRSQKASGPRARIYTDGCLDEAISMLKRFEFSDSDAEQALQLLEFSIWFYRGDKDYPERTPTMSELRDELSELEARAKDLLQALKYLSETGRQSLFETYPTADAFALRKPISELISAARGAHRKVPRGSGRPKESAMLNLLFGIAVLWYRHFNSDYGVTASNGVYRGKLVDFACAILRLEGIRFHSENLVGKHLFTIRSKAKSRAAQAKGVAIIP